MRGMLAEEKLLKLIRVPKSSSSISDKPGLSNISFLQGNRSTLRRVILICFILSCLYLLSSITYSWVGLRQIKLPAVSSSDKAEQSLGADTDLKPYEFYAQGIKNHQIFSVASGASAASASASVNPDVLKDISLIGIFSGDNPQAIIEDKKENQIYYLNKGQSINNIVIEEISGQKVILNYNDQRYELHL